MTFGGRPPLKNVKKLKMAVDCHQNGGIPTVIIKTTATPEPAPSGGSSGGCRRAKRKQKLLASGDERADL